MESISFRKLQVKDLKMMHRWLNSEEVIKWYGKSGCTMEAVEARYIPRISGAKPTNCYVIEMNNDSIGHIQWYYNKDYPAYGEQLGASSHSASVDIFIGEESYRHKGYGSRVIEKFLKDIVFANEGVDECIMAPSPDNIGAIKTYEKVGFEYYKTIELPEEEEKEYLMRLARG